MNKNFLSLKLIIVVMILIPGLVYASSDGHDDFSDAFEIIENNVACEDLSDDEFEHLGDYYMEQMHPGEAHVRMDQMMGGEDSESLRNMHISMGKKFYCNNDEDYSGGGMMESGMMNNKMMSNGMMSGGMMGSIGSFGSGMMNAGFGNIGLTSSMFSFLIFIGLVLMIFFIYKFTLEKVKDPNNILKRRLTQGSITRQEYTDLKKVI